MRWTGALCALLVCFVTCLLVVAFRVRQLRLRARTQSKHTETGFVESDRDDWRRRLFYHRRTNVLGR